ARVETVSQQLFALEDGRGDSEPVLASSRAMVLDERLAPVARTRDAVQACLERRVSAGRCLCEQGRERAVGQHDVGIDERDPARARRAGADETRSRKSTAAVGENRDRITANALERLIR